MHEAYWRRVMELHPTYSYFGRGKVIYDGEHEVDLYVNKEFGRARLHLIDRVPKSGVSKHFRCLKEVRLFPKI